jgi:hypothetical protein
MRRKLLRKGALGLISSRDWLKKAFVGVVGNNAFRIASKPSIMCTHTHTHIYIYIYIYMQTITAIDIY